MKKSNKYMHYYKIAGILILAVLLLLAVGFAIQCTYNAPAYSKDTLRTYTGKLRDFSYSYEYDCSVLLMDNNGRYCIPEDMPINASELEANMPASEVYTVTAAPKKNLDGYYILYSIENSNGVLFSSNTSRSYYMSARSSLWEAYTLICAVLIGIYISLFPFKKPDKKHLRFCRTAVVIACVFAVCSVGLCILCSRSFPLYSESSAYTVSGECSDVWITSKQAARSGRIYNAYISMTHGEGFVISSDAPILRRYGESELNTMLSGKTITVTVAKRLDFFGNATVLGIEYENGEIISVGESHSENLTARICIWIIYFLALSACGLWLYFNHKKLVN